MECAVCGLKNPRDITSCECGYDFVTKSGGSRPPFRLRSPGIFRFGLFIAGAIIVVGMIFGSPVHTLNAIVLVLVTAPHIALGFAWTAWGRAPRKFQAPRVRATLLFSGLLACSLNIAVFWLWVIWLNGHYGDTSAWMVEDKAAEVGGYLSVFAILASILGRGRLSFKIAAIVTWVIWIPLGIGIL